jgi:hypothetical protein
VRKAVKGKFAIGTQNLRSPLTLPRELRKTFSPLCDKGSTSIRFRRFKVQNRNRHAIADTASHYSIVPDETA